MSVQEKLNVQWGDLTAEQVMEVGMIPPKTSLLEMISYVKEALIELGLSKERANDLCKINFPDLVRKVYLIKRGDFTVEVLDDHM